MLLGFSDAALTGHYLEAPHLAAMNLMAYVLWLLYGLFSFVAIGATALVARAVGAGDREGASRVANQAFVVGIVFAVVAVLVGWLGADWIVGRLQLEGESAVLAARFLRFVLPVLPMVMFDAVGIACLRGAGDMIAGLAVMAVVNLVNVAVAWSLVLGLGPLPRLGWDGLAIGTACGYLVGGMLVLMLLAKGRSGLQLRPRWLRPDGALIRRLLRVGVPGGLDTLLVIGCQLWFVAIVNRLGDVAAAAHGIAIRVESLGYLPGLAFQLAATTLAGQFLGAGDPRRAGRAVWTTSAVGGGVMCLAGVLFFTQAQGLIDLFLRAGQDQIALLAVPLLRTVALAMPFLAMSMILTGALRGAGDTVWPLAFSLIGFLGVRIPLAYWLAFPELYLPGSGPIAGWNLGVLGAWYAMAADLAVRGALVAARFAHGGWKQTKV